MFFKKDKKDGPRSYDPAVMEPLIRASICNGEQVAGFKNLQTGEFLEIMLIRDEADLDDFKKRYNITCEIKKVY